MVATVFFNFRIHGVQRTARETKALICSDGEGQLLMVKASSCVPPGADRNLIQNYPHWTPITVLLVALMMMHHQLVKVIPSPEVVKSRQQRRSEAKRPSRVQPPLARYHTVCLDTDRVRANSDGTGTGGWEQAWHQ